MYRPYPPRWITKKNDSFRLETHCSSPSSSTHSAPAAGFSISAWPWRAAEGRISFFHKRTQKWLTGVNPRSRLIRFSKNSSFHYFTVDEMGLRLMKLALDEMALYRFQRYLQQNGICKASTERKYTSCRRACSSRGTADRTNARCHNGGCHRGAAAGH